LLGVSAVSGDMREVLAASKEGNASARLAVDTYTYRVRQAIGALSATLGGVDAIVFTAGVGENSPEVRAATCRGLEYLGVVLDLAANERSRPDVDVARRDARAQILVIAAREDLAMLAGVNQVLAGEHRPEALRAH
jgi:acetate kinase